MTIDYTRVECGKVKLLNKNTLLQVINQLILIVIDIQVVIHLLAINE